MRKYRVRNSEFHPGSWIVEKLVSKSWLFGESWMLLDVFRSKEGALEKLEKLKNIKEEVYY